MTRVKICGLRRPEDIAAANRCLPDYVGFVFAPGSRRQIDASTAQRLREALDRRIRAVGVFVNASPERIAALCHAGIIDAIQLHGDEDAAYIAGLRRAVSAPIIRAVPVGNRPPKPPVGVDYPLYDTASPQRGGVGKPFDWALLRECGQAYFLAGGLDCSNVRRAVEQLRPYGVDVSSGVETDGHKDSEKMINFVHQVRRSNG